MRQTLTAYVVLSDVFFHPRQRQRPGRFRYRAHIFKQVFHRRTDRIAIDGNNVVEIFLAQTEGFVTDTFYRHAFSKETHARQIHRMTGIQRRLQAGGVFGFDGNHFDLRHQLFDQHRHARRQTATAHRHKHAVEVCVLLEQLQGQRTLSGDHHRVIERRNPGKALLLRQFNRFGFGFIKVSAVQQHFAAKAANSINFDIGSRHRHDNQRLQAQTRRGERHALSMVARRSGDDPTRFLFRR
ncbi:Uncharacterised protein [Escherichia coli]|nr:Uncharacterised protein [Escherichia coli]